jgi:hypothetical protein
LKKRYDDETSQNIYVDLLSFLSKDGQFAGQHYWAITKTVDPRVWWKSQFNSALSKLAQSLLSITPSAGAAERNWSTFGHIHSKTRNRLKHDRVSKLVYIQTNMRCMENIPEKDVWLNEDELFETEVNEALDEEELVANEEADAVDNIADVYISDEEV